MSDIAIKVEGLGKKYLIGQQQKSGDFRNAFGGKLKSLFGKKGFTAGQQEFWALQDINFEIKKGEVVGIIGSNGAGKSTLLKILSRITEPTKGRFEINGRVSSLLEVGTGFHMELTGRENIYLNGTILGMRRGEIKQKLDEIIAFSGVEKFLDTPVKHYSSGMKVRLAFSVAAHLEPEILIVDEVLAVGDAEFQAKCLGKMEDVAGKGRTVLFVSHNMGAVQRLCNKGTLLRRGTVVYSGQVSECISRYLALNSSEESLSSINLKERKGSGEVLVKDFTIETSDSLNVSTLLIGQAFQVNIKYEVADQEFDLTGLRFGVKFTNLQGDPLFFHYSRLVDFNYDNEDIRNSKQAICNIINFPLNEGKYIISLSIFKDNQYIDNIENVKSISLISGKIYNYKENPSPNHSLVLGHAEWYLK